MCWRWGGGRRRGMVAAEEAGSVRAVCREVNSRGLGVGMG